MVGLRFNPQPSSAPVALFQGSGATLLPNPITGRGTIEASGGGGTPSVENLISIPSAGTLSVGLVGIHDPTSFSIDATNTIQASSSGLHGVVVGGLNNIIGDHSAPAVLGGSGNSATNDYAFVGGGQNNHASGDHSAIPGGSSNTTSGDHSLAMGDSNSVSASYSCAYGFDNNVSGNNYSYAFGTGNANSGGDGAFAAGDSNILTGRGSVILGFNGEDRGNRYANIFSGGGHSPGSTRGMAQTEEYVFFAGTSGTGVVTLTTDDNGLAGNNCAALGSPGACIFEADFLSVDTNTGAALTHSFGPSLMTRAGGSGASTASSGNPAATVGPATTTPPTLAQIPAIAGNANGGFTITVQAPAGNSDSWNFTCRLKITSTLG